MAVGVKLVDYRQVDDQSVLARAVSGDHLEPARLSPDLAPRDLDQRGDLGMSGHLAGDVEQHRRLLARGGTDHDLSVRALQQLPDRKASERG